MTSFACLSDQLNLVCAAQTYVHRYILETAANSTFVTPSFIYMELPEMATSLIQII